VLRPVTEQDWPRLLRWNQNPEVLRWVESPDNPPYDLAQLQRVYRGVSQAAFCFIIKSSGTEIGECWLQRMNIERILRAHLSLECRRIDIMIGEPRFWGRGIGSEAWRGPSPVKCCKLLA
jgi:RimJ/RimL family protein N-acetyltransferase